MSSRSQTVARNIPLVTTASLAASATLACASFSAAQKAFAQAAPPVMSLSSANETRYHFSQIAEVLLFIRFIAQYEVSIPPLEHRARAFATLKNEKVIDLIGLNPLERRCFEMLASSSPTDIQTLILKTHTKVKGGTFSESDMFGTLAPEQPHVTSARPFELSGPERLAYRNTLGLCYLMRGIRTVRPPSGIQNASWSYITSLPESRQDKLLMCVGALGIAESAGEGSVAGRVSRSFLVNVGQDVSKEERSKIPELASLANYTDSPFVYRLGVITAVTGLGLYLYGRAQARWNVSEQSSSEPAGM